MMQKEEQLLYHISKLELKFFQGYLLKVKMIHRYMLKSELQIMSFISSEMVSTTESQTEGVQ